MRGRGHHLKLLTRDEVRRIAANIAQLPDLLRPPFVLMWTLSTGGPSSSRNFFLNMINAGAAFALRE